MEGLWLRNSRDGTAVVFVHGILSSGESCWLNANGTYWPDLLVAEPRLSSIGVYVFTYQTDIFSGTFSLGDVVAALQEHMRLDGVLDSDRMVFVCHSMGGIVVRKYVVSRALDLIEQRILVGLYLVASPSLGAEYANLFAMFARVLKHTQLDALRFTQTNTWLNDLDREFLNLKEHGRLKIRGREIIEDKFIVFPKLFRKQVVEPFTGARYFADWNKVAGSDHFSIAKPANAGCMQHRMLIDFIESLLPHPVSDQASDAANLQPLGHHFVCYSATDGSELALWLAREMEYSAHGLRCWVAERDLGKVEDILGAVDDALRGCASFIFILTRSATLPEDRCMAEWKRAISYNKPITVVHAEGAPPCPLPLETRKSFNVSADPAAALPLLISRLANIPSPSGQLETLREQIAGSKRAVTYAPFHAKARLQFEIDAIEKQIAVIESALRDEHALRTRVMTAVERERRTVGQIEVQPTANLRFVNAPPLAVPNYFEDRTEETGLTIEFLRDPAASILLVHGRGGVGKTALVCRVLRELERDQLPDGAGKFRAAAVVYINCTRARADLFEEILTGIRATLSRETQNELKPILENPHSTVSAILRALLPRLPSDPTVVLLDNFEDVVSPEASQITNAEIDELLSFVMQASQHSMKVVITTREVPRDFWNASPARLKAISLAEGLHSPYAERVLRRLDADGSAGLKDASDVTLAQAVSVCLGFPRALEAFYSRIKGDPTADVDDLIQELRVAGHPKNQISWVLVGEAFSRLLPIDQKVMQSVAIYGRPVSDTGVQYVLSEWAPYIDAQAVLQRLVGLHFIRREGRAYYLHPIDRQYALSFLQREEKQHLHSIGANYYREIERPRDEWVSLQDINSHLEQFRLRIDADDLDSAASILSDISDFLDRRGAFELKLSLAVALTKGAGNDWVKAISLEEIASAQWRIGRAQEAVATQAQLVELLNANDVSSDRLFTARSNLVVYRGSLPATEARLEEVRSCLAEVEAKKPYARDSIVTMLTQLVFALEELGFLDEALSTQQRANDLAQEFLDVNSREATIHNLGEIYLARGEVGRAKGLYKRALTLNTQSNNPLWKANHFGRLAQCALQRGHWENGLRYLDDELSIRREIGDLDGTGLNGKTRAAFLLAKGNLERAMREATIAFELTRDLRRELRDYRTLCAEVSLALGNVDEAYSFVSEQDDGLAATWDFDNIFGIVLLFQGMQERAQSCFERAEARSELWLSRSAVNPSAIGGKALALAGIAATGTANVLPLAIEVYRAAMKNDLGRGRVAEWKRRLQQLAAASDRSTFHEILSMLGE